MSDTAILVHTAVTIAVVVVLILRLKVTPVIALILGPIYLGLVTGLGPKKTADTIASGFGELMTEIGLLIAFGVLLGSLLASMGAIQKLVALILRRFGPERLPYTFSLSLGTVLQSIFIDVLLVITAPLARSLAPQMGRHGTAKMSAAMAVGLETGLVLVVPGVGAVALAGLLHVPLGTMLLCGVLVEVPTVLITMFLFNRLLRRGLWKADRDEQPVEAAAADLHPGEDQALPPLWLSLSPLLVALTLIAFGAIADIAGLEAGVITFLGNPLIALFIGLTGAYVLAQRTLSSDRAAEGIRRGFHESGQILILTGVGGSLAAMVNATGLGDILEGYFSASTVAPLLLVWAVAAILHLAIGSVSIAAITSAGLLAPIAGDLEVSTVLIALAAGAGSLFAVHVTSNTFWLLQTLLGQSTQGTLKTCSLAVSMASVVALGNVLVLSLVI